MGLDANRKNDVSAGHAVPEMMQMLSGSISEHRIQIAMPPNVLDWLKVEARVYGMRAPEWIRHRLINLYEDRPQDWQTRLKG